MGWEDEDGKPAVTSGKRIRPALCLFAGSLFGTPPDLAMPGAVAVELIHNFSLVHDEVQDHDAQRHHRPTLWALLGEGQAINAGDYLITRATNALLTGSGDESRRLRALRILNDAMARMIAGQWADISFESRDDVAPAEYIEMIRGKTGALLGAPLAVGAVLAGASEQQAQALGAWGETIGLAFQVRDDYLGIWGDPNLTGKSNTGDIVRKKKTLPVVHGLANGAGDVIRSVYTSGEVSSSGIETVVAALEAAHSDAYVNAEAANLASDADAMLDSFELPASSREELRRIGAYLVERDR
jgi:geranylgeranyl diphosphate synthase type I